MVYEGVLAVIKLDHSFAFGVWPCVFVLPLNDIPVVVYEGVLAVIEPNASFAFGVWPWSSYSETTFVVVYEGVLARYRAERELCLRRMAMRLRTPLKRHSRRGL